jgi:hypothetical protein
MKRRSHIAVYNLQRVLCFDRNIRRKRIGIEPVVENTKLMRRGP